MIAIPDFAAGAMENWGLITYRETDMLYDEMTSSATDKEDVVTTITHELGHQVPLLVIDRNPVKFLDKLYRLFRGDFA